MGIYWYAKRTTIRSLVYRVVDRSNEVTLPAARLHGQQRLAELTRTACRKNDARELQEFFGSAQKYLDESGGPKPWTTGRLLGGLLAGRNLDSCIPNR